MGHLYYTELGNKGYYDTSGNYQPESGLTNTGDFQNLQPGDHWLGTEYATDLSEAWFFEPEDGAQSYMNKNMYPTVAIALRDGNVASTVVPEPVSSALFLTGGAALGFRRLRKR